MKQISVQMLAALLHWEVAALQEWVRQLSRHWWTYRMYCLMYRGKATSKKLTGLNKANGQCSKCPQALASDRSTVHAQAMSLCASTPVKHVLVTQTTLTNS